MKKTIILLSSLAVLLTACGDDKKTTTTDDNGNSEENASLTVNDDEGKTGSFSASGTDFKGRSSTQYFGDKVTGQYSVLCQQDEPFALLQAIFSNEKETTGTFKPKEGFMSIEPGQVHVALSGTAIGDKEFVTKSSSTGSVSVSGRTLTIKDLKLYNRDNAEKVVSASIDF